MGVNIVPVILGQKLVYLHELVRSDEEGFHTHV